MWPFDAPKGLSKLQEQVATLERDMRNLRLDWETTYEKIRTLMARLAKRASVLENADQLPSNGEGAGEPTDPLSPTFSRLTQRQKQVQLEIMRRRAGVGGK